MLDRASQASHGGTSTTRNLASRTSHLSSIRRNHKSASSLHRTVYSAPMECSVCGKAFSRPEHVKRHMSVHDEERPFACNHCGKRFGRKDSASRHERSHVYGPTISRIEPSIRRTCNSCAKARVRCSGHRPCTYCATRELDCLYKSRKRRRTLQPLSQTLPPEDSCGGQSSPATSLLNHQELTQDVEPLTRCHPDHSNACLDQHGSGNVQSDTEHSNIAIPSPLVCYSTEDDIRDRSLATSSNLDTVRSDHLGHTPVNWLPYRELSLDPQPQLEPTQGLTADGLQPFGATTSLHLTNEAMLPTEVPTHTLAAGPSNFQHDQISTLIASMLAAPSPVGLESALSWTEKSQIGSLYADGAGARWSQSNRRADCGIRTPQISHSRMPGSLSADSTWISLLNETIRLRAANHQSGFEMTPDVHNELLGMISDSLSLYIHPPDGVANLDSLLAQPVWEYLIQLYFEHFHPIYPFLDQSLLALPAWGWALCLATASMGARYVKLEEMTLYGELLSQICHELFLRDLETGRIDDSLPFLQARALCAINLCHSRQRELMDRGNTALAMMYNSSLRLKLLGEDPRVGEFCQGQDPEQAWIAWRFRETRRRTSIFILVSGSESLPSAANNSLQIVTANMAFTRDTSPSLNLGEHSLLSPSSERLWRAETCKQWFKCRTASEQVVLDVSEFQNEENSRLTMQEILQGLWVQRSLRGPISPFVSEAVILILIRRSWFAEQYLDAMFPSWLESRNSQPQVDSLGSSRPPCLGADAEFAKWRNTVCDCLDVLHWDALSVSAKAGGFESTAFLTLHLARLLLLTPVRALFDCLHECAGCPTTWILPQDLDAVKSNRRESYSIVQRWCSQDRHKARLALIHAGAMFWHVRRYGRESYMQPFAVYLATVVLWAYGTTMHECSVHERRRSHSQHEAVHTGLSTAEEVPGQDQSVPTNEVPPSLSDSRMPRQMQLDRPMDDELVQHFIRYGSLQLYLEGVPDLCNAQGPTQILNEGIAILKQSARTWTITERYAQSLHDVARLVRNPNPAL